MRLVQRLEAGFDRRGFLGLGLASGIAWMLSRGARAAASPAGEEGVSAPAPDRLPPGRAKRCIVLFMDGGPSHMDSWDPKPGREFQGPTETIPTPIPGVRIAAALPAMASRVRDLCIVRSMTSREGNHSRAKYLLHAGYPPNPTVVHPAFGSLLSHEAGDPGFDLPSFVQVNGNNGESGGYLGVAHDPFVIQDPGQPIANLAPPPGVDDARLDGRMEFLARLDRRFGESRGTEVPESRQVMYARSRRLMASPLTRAFDLSREKDAVRERYGRDSFGQGCLMASRLVEAGVPVVEVRLGGWDTHQDNWTKVPQLLAQVDRGFSNLLDDLRAKGLLGETLVVWTGEFGRTPRPNPRGGRDHHPRAWSMVMAGGGVLGGQVVGETDADAAEVIDRPVTVPDLFASWAHAFGLNPRKTFYAGERPVTLVDRAGAPVREFFA
ncbi:MAG: DUF1501 domain-containing protein [Planctomycetaceae bacterium]|nr:DUF1501 domain-containing protein [Planctomycetota bacterium]NUN52783.1 DUF1501 domain-containing protein [Planctomycetaceae bacterium]